MVTVISERSLKNLEGLHPDLKAVFRTVLNQQDDVVLIEGLRTAERQKELVDKGASQTMNSRHLTGHAGDLAIIRDGVFIKEFSEYKDLAKKVKDVAKYLKIPIEWGGDWKSRDGLHFQLPWKDYPIGKQKTVASSKTIAAASAGVPLTALVPEIMKAIEGFSEALKGFSAEWATTVQLILMSAIAAFIIYERVRKLNEDGL